MHHVLKGINRCVCISTWRLVQLAEVPLSHTHTNKHTNSLQGEVSMVANCSCQREEGERIKKEESE